MPERRRFNQTTPLKERLLAFAEEAREKARSTTAGAEREGLIRKARRADTAAHIDEWVSSKGLQSPK